MSYISYLGIDYGRRKIGVALATGPLADPLTVLYFTKEDEAIRKLKKIVLEERIDRLVIGISERDIADEAQAFGKKLSEEVQKEVIFVDETLTTFDAKEKAIESGMRRSKRRAMEDALSAALILQNYLDIQPTTTGYSGSFSHCSDSIALRKASLMRVSSSRVDRVTPFASRESCKNAPIVFIGRGYRLKNYSAGSAASSESPFSKS